MNIIQSPNTGVGGSAHGNRFEDDFNNIFMNSCEVDPREAELDKELGKYYAAADGCDNKTAYRHWIEFRRRAALMGYSLPEINRAKLRADK